MIIISKISNESMLQSEIVFALSQQGDRGHYGEKGDKVS